MGIVVLPSDVNKSVVGFSLEKLTGLSQAELERSLSIEGLEGGLKQGIRFGLSAVKNVGISAIESIILAREKGEFKSLMDITSKVDTRLANKKTLESLIKAGAMDHLGNRASQLLILDACLEESHKLAKNRLSGQVSLFGGLEEIESLAIKLPVVDEMPLDEMLTFEKDLLGFYLHEPPYLPKLKQVAKLVNLKLTDIGDHNIGQKVTLGGVITQIKKVLTKKNAAEMAFITISDGLGSIEAVVFPATFEASKSFLMKDAVIITGGRIDKREDKPSLVIDKIDLFDPQTISDIHVPTKSVEIIVPKGTNVSVLQAVNKTLRGFPGNIPVVIILQSDRDDRRMNLPFSIDMSDILEEEINKLLGANSFKYTF